MVVALVAAGLLYFVAMLIALVTARSAMLSGVGEIHSLQSSITATQVERDPLAALDRADPSLQRAESDFAGADSSLRWFAPVVRHLGWLPRFGQELAAAPAAAALGHDATSGALGLLDGLRPVLTWSGRGPGSSRLSASVLLNRIAANAPGFSQACTSLSDAEDARRQFAGYSSSTITSRLATVDRELPRLTLLCRTLVVLPGILGYRRPASYLIAYLNPNQIRASGGFLGSAGLLTLRDGKASQHFTGTGLLDNLSYRPPDPIAMEEGEPGWLFRDSNWSPDFPTSAALERFFASLDLGWKVQGVLNLTPQATVDAVRALGSFYSPEYHRWITPGNVAVLADYYAHRAHEDQVGPFHYKSGDTARKQFIAIVGSHLFSQLSALTPTKAVRLLNAMGDAISHGDLLVNFTDPAAQQLVTQAGAAGGVNRTTGDYLYVVHSNLSYNKINAYVHVRTAYHVTVRQDRWLQSDLTLTFHNVPAPAYIYDGSYGPGAGRTGVPADYADYVRVLVPAGAQLLHQSGWTTEWSPGPAYGKTELGGYIIVRKGQTRTVHLSYVTPPNVFSWSQGRDYRLTVQHQPGMTLDRLDVSVSVDGHRYQRSIRSPSSDWSVSLPVSRRSYHPLPLPNNPFPVVAPGHWIEPHTYFGLR